MRIIYVGNFTQRHCTEVHIAKTLENLGHEVIQLQENDPATLYELDNRMSAWKQVNIDLFLFTRTWGETVTLEHLDKLHQYGIPSASYHLDLYVGLSRKYLHKGKSLDEILQTDPFWRTDFVFTPDGDQKSAEVFKRNGVKHYYLKPGVFEPDCYMAYPEEPKIDVLFVGGGDKPGSPNGYGHPEWPYRDKLIGWLYEIYGERFKKFGHPQETVRNEELNQLYANSKVVVGDSVCIDFNHSHYWSDRVYETLGRGGFLIHPYIKGMEEEFKDKEHLVYYPFGSVATLKELIDYYLEHDEERERIRRAGHEFVKNNATYTHRIKQMLDIVFAKGLTLGEIMDAVDNPQVEVIKHDLVLGDMPFKINLGAGSEPTEGWVNVDWIKGEGIQVKHNLLLFPWPFEDGCADEIKAIDVLEHMPNYTPDNQATALAFVEECHRLLQPGGKLTIQVPHWNSPNMWIDPTHVRGFDPKSMDYFDPETDFGKWYGYYTKGKFKVIAELSKMPDGSPSNVTFTMVKI